MSTRTSQPALSAGRLDHVAIAVPDSRAADRRFAEALGGGLVARGRGFGAYIRQYRYANGFKIEVLAPDRSQTISSRLLAHLRARPASIHHMTLLVDSISDVKHTLDRLNIEHVAEAHQPDGSHEIFVRPDDAAGMLLQIVSRPMSDVDWARTYGQEPEPCRTDAASFHGVRLPHHDPVAARQQLARLGAEVDHDDGFVVARWHRGPVVWIEGAGATTSLAFTDASPADDDPALGPAIAAPPSHHRGMP